MPMSSWNQFIKVQKRKIYNTSVEIFQQKIGGGFKANNGAIYLHCHTIIKYGEVLITAYIRTDSVDYF